ncbi:hypothetical protein MICRO116_230029 [Micrococcus sp. 116]|nr:hypothetical protein MICRO116_230029 [Micrococcus sp. 116]
MAIRVCDGSRPAEKLRTSFAGRWASSLATFLDCQP